jgi:hypothetical protein
MMLKAAQVIGKLDRVFNRDDLAGIIDPTLVQRAGRLLSDYTTLLRGFAPPGEIAECDLIPVIEAVVTGLSVSSCSDEDLLSSSDDDAAFSRILLNRIGTRPLLEDVEFTLPARSESLKVFIDREHFIDLLTYILEDLVGTGSTRIEIRTQCDGRTAAVSISGDIPPGTPPEKRRTWRFLQGFSIRIGGMLQLNRHKGLREFRFTATAI